MKCIARFLRSVSVRVRDDVPWWKLSAGAVTIGASAETALYEIGTGGFTAVPMVRSFQHWR